jgi:hypothetical protein
LSTRNRGRFRRSCMQNSCPTEVKIEDQNSECLKLNCYRKAHTDKNLLIKKFCARHQTLEHA